LTREGDDRRPVELAEMGAEPHQLVVVETLAAEAQHKVIGPRLFNGVHCGCGQLLRKVDTFDIGAEGRPQSAARKPSAVLKLLPSFAPSLSRTAC
jgi:hypothetical protein